tara:strand:+ start:200 stop:661 length:462 start_codon:yes stop_codon:yes gene_type:complete
MTQQKNKKLNVFKKQVMKTFYEDIILEHTYDDIDSQKIPIKENVINLKSKCIKNSVYDDIDQTNIVIKYYEKNTKPIYMFPSTNKIYDVQFDDKTIIKINNRLYLNFAKSTYRSDPSKTFNYIYINYNNNDKCDIKLNIKCINEMIETITSFM